AEAAGPAHIVDLGQMLDPERVDGPEQDEALDGRPVFLADLLRLGLELCVGELEEVLPNRGAAAELPQVVLAGARLVAEAHCLDRGREALHTPVVDAVAGEVAVDE